MTGMLLILHCFRNHVISDLRPYVCVFDECSDPDHGYQAETHWFEHEQWQHNVSWSCNGFNAHAPAIFGNRSEFRAHFETSHSGLFSPSDIDKHLEVSATPSKELFTHCPFCDFTIGQEQLLEGPGTSAVSQIHCIAIRIASIFVPSLRRFVNFCVCVALSFVICGHLFLSLDALAAKKIYLSQRMLFPTGVQHAIRFTHSPSLIEKLHFVSLDFFISKITDIFL